MTRPNVSLDELRDAPRYHRKGGFLGIVVVTG